MKTKEKEIHRFERSRPVVYFLRCEGLVKIGKSTYGSLASRIESLQTGCPKTLVLVGLLPDKSYTFSKSVTAYEFKIHKRFAHLRKSGEWFEWNSEIATFLQESA
jgi:hypothetical protein